MNNRTLLVGEPMGLFVAEETGLFERVNHYTFTTCGAEFNTAIGLRRLGQSVGFFTKLGDDPFGKRILAMMNQNGISTELVELCKERPTGFMLKSKVVNGDPEIFYLRKNSAASTIGPEDIADLDLSCYSAIHMTGIFPALSQSTRNAALLLMERAKQEGIFISFDPNLRPALWPDEQTMIETLNALAFKADLFLPGIQEARLLSGLYSPEEICTFYQNHHAGMVILKMGPEGAWYSTPSQQGYIAGFKVDAVVDTVGAGDGFAAGVLSGIHDGLSIEQAVRRGNGVGAIQVMSLGDNDGLPILEELEAFMNGSPAWSQNRRPHTSFEVRPMIKISLQIPGIQASLDPMPLDEYREQAAIEEPFE